MINSTNLIVNQDGSIFHLGVKPEELASNVILVGDPGRVQLIASFFEHIECKRQNREFVMITGLYKGIRISVMATGIGTDNIDIVLNEIDALVNVDFDKRKIKHELTKLNLLRLGTCGSFQKHVKPGDLVISKKAYGQDSLMLYYQDYLSKFIKDNKELKAVQQYFSENHLGPVNYIAESNDYLLKKFESIGHCGITLTSSGFYGPQGRKLRTDHLAGWHSDHIAKFEDIEGNKVCNLEMECSALYGLGGLLGHKCLTICLAIAQRSTKEVLVDYKIRMKEIIPQVLDNLIESC
ncbi:MAG: phosphorylase [Saprospirales bacterium]|nr:phosphorylase [Saprospirales bacterium]|tara:strand:+ start:14459 stop:15340 length:882 start_codon:yes stop_codon:yes gene_type:complete